MITIILILFALLAGAGKAVAIEPQTVNRLDCRASLSVPDGIRYVDISGTTVNGNDLCELAFVFMGSLKNKHRENGPAMPDDWRAEVDFWITIEKIPLSAQIKMIDSFTGGRQSGIFSLTSRNHIKVVGGDGYVFTYSAVRPTASMRRLGQSREIIFAAGDESHSAIYYLYPTGSQWRQNKIIEILQEIFSSLRFYPMDQQSDISGER